MLNEQNVVETPESIENTDQDTLDPIEQAAADAASEALENGADQETLERHAADAAEKVLEQQAKQVKKASKPKSAKPKGKKSDNAQPKPAPAVEAKQESQQQEGETTVTTQAPPKKKKTAAKPTSKAGKGGKKADPSKNGQAPRTKKEGLREPQVRILVALAKAPDGLTRSEIAQKAKVDPAMGHYLGHSEPAKYAEWSDKYGFPSLLHLGFVKAQQHDRDGRSIVLHLITAKGKAALEKVTKV